MRSEDFCDMLIENGFAFATGVPDSIFAAFIDRLQESGMKHIMATSEGEACGVAAGYHLATRKVPMVYIQNSGFGNCVNPLTSLLDENVYSIPALLLISWRGQPGQKDEPQHYRMGQKSASLLEILGIPFEIAVDDSAQMRAILNYAKEHFWKKSSPFAILFPKRVLKSTAPVLGATQNNFMLREQALEILTESLGPKDVIISTTGKTSRELFEIRERKNQCHGQDFLNVGAMGCAASIALGVAHARPDRRVVLVDGDGAALMKMGTMATIGHYRPANLLHVLLDNNAHESTGGQKTVSHTVKFDAVACACNYGSTETVCSAEQFRRVLEKNSIGPRMIVAKIKVGSRPDLGRPASSPIQNKRDFMSFLGLKT